MRTLKDIALVYEIILISLGIALLAGCGVGPKRIENRYIESFTLNVLPRNEIQKAYHDSMGHNHAKCKPPGVNGFFREHTRELFVAIDRAYGTVLHEIIHAGGGDEDEAQLYSGD